MDGQIDRETEKRIGEMKGKRTKRQRNCAMSTPRDRWTER